MFGSGTMDSLKCFVARIRSLKRSHLTTTSSVTLLSSTCYFGMSINIFDFIFFSSFLLSPQVTYAFDNA